MDVLDERDINFSYRSGHSAYALYSCTKINGWKEHITLSLIDSLVVELFLLWYTQQCVQRPPKEYKEYLSERQHVVAMYIQRDQKTSPGGESDQWAERRRWLLPSNTSLWRSCNLIAFIHSSTGPVVHLFASRHEGPGFNPLGVLMWNRDSPASVVSLHWWP